MKGDAMAPIDPASPKISPICPPVNPSPPSATGADRYRPAKGSQAPQTAYWRNIMIDNRPSFPTVGCDIGVRM